MTGKFFISYNDSGPGEISGYDSIRFDTITLFTNRISYIHKKWHNGVLILIGDPVYDFDLEALEVTDIIRRVSGNYYGLLIKGDEALLFSSFLGILPIYYLPGGNACSNSYELISKIIDNPDIDRQFILETILFNYPFSDRTIYKEIKLLGSFEILKFSKGKLLKSPGVDVSELFLKGEAPQKYSVEYLSAFFIQNVQRYLPADLFSVTFTGGFDSRTLVGASLFYNRKFRTCSFGKKENPDIALPLKHSEELGLNHFSCLLDSSEYTGGIYFDKALEITGISPGFNGFLYPHFLYLAEQESASSKYLLTGYFGSELFRTMHVAGAVTSKALVEIFSLNGKGSIGEILGRPEFTSVLNVSEFTREIDSLESEINDYFNKGDIYLTRNERFYKFILEETFRKLFGTLINVQQSYLTVRTPYLDYSFIRLLFSSRYAGIYNQFFTHNPARRFTGQKIYAGILKKSSAILYSQKTGKGYPPSYLEGSLAPIKLLIPFISKRLSGRLKEHDLDNLGILTGLDNSYSYLEGKLDRHSELFNRSYILGSIQDGIINRNEFVRDRVLSVLSITSSL